jgi:very-short-patch-repair endonuclease
MHNLPLILIFIVLVIVAAGAGQSKKHRRKNPGYRAPKRAAGQPSGGVPRKDSWRRKSSTFPQPKLPEEKRYFSKRLLTENEKEFFLRLKEALPAHHVMAQVSMGALIDVKNWGSRQHWQYWQRRSDFDKKIIDFVVLNADLEVVTIIELDDRSHDGKKAKDRERDEMVASAGYPTIRYQSTPEQRPSVQTIAANVAYIERAMAQQKGEQPALA